MALFLARVTPWVLVVGGAVGTAAAFALVLDRLALLADPSYVPSCSLSPLLSCGSVLASPQAELLGFPNPLLGLAEFPVLVTTGVALLAGATLPRWYWWGLQAGVTAGLLLVAWLIGQSLYRIGALCPYCMVVWAVVITTFWYVTLHNLAEGRFPPPVTRRAAGAVRWHATLVTASVLVVGGLVLEQFWSYWTTLV